VVRTALVERNPQSERQEQEIVTMHKLFALVAVVLLASCSTVDATYEGGKGVVNGVAEDGFGITSGTFDVISNVIKDVADKTGVDIKEDAE
jgi:phage-related protein